MGTQVKRSNEEKIATATTDFISARLPDWLSRASAAQIAALRGLFAAHRASQQRLRQHTAQLLPLQVYAEQRLSTLLASPLADGVPFSSLEWLEITPSFDTLTNLTLPTYGYGERRRNGLLQLMSNFAPTASYYQGTGLVMPGKDQVLSGDVGNLVQACRTLDVGKQYQGQLNDTFTPEAIEALAADKQAGFRLACKIAALKGEISGHEELALREIAEPDTDKLPSGLRSYPGLLQVLGHPVADGLYITLKDSAGAEKAVVLYLPGDPVRALRRYDNGVAMQRAVVAELADAGYRQFFSQLIGIEQRPAFIRTLALRLRDPRSDLQLLGRVPPASVFSALAQEQVQRVKDDARLLLVPTAQADAKAARARIEDWESVGMGILNLAGLFMPVVGAMLLGQLVVQTVADVYEGFADLAEGHQHEALQHLFDVLETVLASAATAGTGVLVSNAVVAAMEPVNLGGRGQRLWSGDLTSYQSQPESLELGSNGLYTQGGRQWMRAGSRYFEVHRPDPEAPYCVRHPLRSDAYAPEVVHNGERCWRLLREHPQAWDDPQRMLDTLWPQHPPASLQRVRQMLHVAGVDEDELRGILLENRRTPVNLRETLRRFEVDARVERFFAHVRAGQLPVDELPLLQWCESQALVGTGVANVRASQTALREPLFEHLASLPPMDDALLTLLRRDFVALPEAYARELLHDVSAHTRREAIAGQKVPLALATKAASLMRVARLNRALEGLYLSNAYSDDSGALVLAVMTQRGSASVNLELREGSAAGRLIGSVVAHAVTEAAKVLVRDQGRFWLYDAAGHALTLAVDDAGDLFRAVVAALSTQQLAEFDITGADPAGQLRSWVMAQLPSSHQGLAQLLNWAPQPKWFNPGRRLDDGRVGYPLSGRGAGSGTPSLLLRAILLRYFPGLTPAQVELEIERRIASRGSAYQVLLDVQDDHMQLQRTLNQWVGSELNETRRALRVRVREEIARAWRVQAEPVIDGQGRHSGQRLRLFGLQISSLPEIPMSVEFNHVSALVLNETGLTHLPSRFIEAFSALRELNLGNNNLLRIPHGIGYLTELRELNLRHNNIRPDSASLAALQSLARLTHLDLSYNPLGQYAMSYSRLPHLVRLGLRSCQLGTWPEGLWLCGFLEEGDLRDNALTEVPAEIRLMPYEFRRSLLVDNNPLPSLDLLALRALDTIVEAPESIAANTPDAEQTRAWWLGADEQAQAGRAVRWQRLSAQAGGGDLLHLLERLMPLADYAWTQGYMTEQLWALLAAADVDDNLRSAMLRLVGQRPTDDNAVIDCFSQLLVHRLRSQSGALAADEPVGSRDVSWFNLGRSLFRLEQVERVARQDINARNARREVIDAPGIRLAYRVRLRQWLGLPGQPRAMHVSDLNRITSEQLLAARRAVREAETPAALVAYLGQRPFWQALMQRTYAADLATIEQVYQQGAQALLAQRAALGEQQYQAQLIDLEDQRDAAKRALSLRFIHVLERRAG
ncbi:NEL-type E3 ubiquitin ligase domain-containing protein [Pseudomonas sp.]|uniref:NEL-type E3 ubiquitin ligase domain-containing protein n=1 Tax=Pseudomonas sp. TaxID=306 RepID=UPI0028A70F65|nr:NEL-type E3 ubiquitin ligase domain-containing protein [Pseudomonas sp.]